MIERTATAKRVLFLAEAVTLAHVGRCIRLAGVLHRAGFEVLLACDSRHERFLTGLPFPTLPLRSIPSEDFLTALARGRAVYSEETLTHYVQDDLRLLAAVRPDAVVGDFRISLSVSARLAGVPYANVTNAYWSPYARPNFRLPGLPFARHVGANVGDWIFRMARPLAFAVHAAPMNRVRLKNGMPPLRADVREAYCDGDLTLYADIPRLIPVFDAPPTHRYIGAVLWSPVVDRPAWWNEVMAGEPPIYVSLGSSGPVRLLPMVIDALQPLGRDIVVATAGRGDHIVSRGRVRVADFVPGDLISAKACVVVCNGGSPASLQALVSGVPVIGIASNLDQYLNMDYVERFGAGTLLRAERVDEIALRNAVQRVLKDARYHERAKAVGTMAAAIEVDAVLPAAIRELIDGRTARATV